MAAARAHAQLMASEVRASGVDLSFAPVVDLGRGNRAIGDRAFSDDPQIVATFTRAYVQALHGAGMAATLKHFPGHGTVLEDTHVDHASDPRPLEALQAEDLVPFVAGIEAGADAVMMAHVVYPRWPRNRLGIRSAGSNRSCAARWASAAWSFRRYRHGRLVECRRRGRPGACASGCRLRCGVGLPPGTGRRIAAGRAGPSPQYRRIDRLDRPRRIGLGWPARRHRRVIHRSSSAHFGTTA